MLTSTSFEKASSPISKQLNVDLELPCWDTYILELGAQIVCSAKYWSGITDLQTGYKKICQKKYSEGACHLLKGSIHMAVLGIVGKVLFSLSNRYYLRGSQSRFHPPLRLQEVPEDLSNQSREHRTLGPIPEVQPELEYNDCKDQKNPITIVTAFDDAIKDYANPIVENQRAYAAKHGYCYAVYKGNLANDHGIPRAPYWSKIVAIWDQWKKSKEESWIVWMDASAIVTNTDKTFADIISQHGRGNKYVILTQDPEHDRGVPINNAVFTFKRNTWTKDWIEKIWSRSDLSKGGEGNCGRPDFPYCHFEQQAMTELWQKDRDVQQYTSLISNRAMNSAYRFTHNDRTRNLFLDYSQDLPNVLWKGGDFICKVTGMEGRLRTPMTQYVLDNCIDQDCSPPQTEEAVEQYQKTYSNLRRSS